VDWTDETHQRNGIKVSIWRTKLKSKSGKSEQHQRDNQLRAGAAFSRSHDDSEEDFEVFDAPAIFATAKKVTPPPTAKKGKPSAVEDVIVKIAPLHVFVDLTMAMSGDGALSFLEDVLDSSSKDNVTCESPLTDEQDCTSDDDNESGNTPPATPSVPAAGNREQERRRLERLVLEDLNLDIDYGQKGLSKSIRVPRLRTGQAKQKVCCKRLSQDDLLTSLHSE
jgi:autophagy-related protein 2